MAVAGRPTVRLPWEAKDPSVPAGVRGADMDDPVVELLRRYANRSDLLVDLSQAVDRLQGRQLELATDPPDELTSCCQQPRRRLLSTRFTYDDIASMITKYDQGETAKLIAAEHQISLTSLKRLIREHGVRRRDSDSAR